jgi:hypothetical protein
VSHDSQWESTVYADTPLEKKKYKIKNYTQIVFLLYLQKMPKKQNAKDMTQKVDKNRPKSKHDKKEEQKKHKQMVSYSTSDRKAHTCFVEK